MRSIFAKILIWSLGTCALAPVAYWAIERRLERHGPSEADPFWSMVALVEDDTCRAYEERGPDGLAAHLRWLDSKLPGEHFLTDARGRDLVTGVDRAELLRPWSTQAGPPRMPDGRIVLAGRPRGGRYRFLTVVRPWFEKPNMLPYFGAIVLVIAGLGSILALHLISPLRHLRGVVDRFGRGDLAARARSTRKDEIGELSRAFDEMADRIKTLLSAERRLLQDVSHELRSPLTRLDVAADLALTSPDRGASLGRIKREIVRLSSLVDELLQLTRAEGDPSARVPEEVRLNELLRDLVFDCAVEAEAKGCRLALCAEESGAIRGERELLRRAIENVVRNAIRHAPEGTAVEIDLERRDGAASLVVRDHGPGVPPDRLEAIFEPFFRVEPDRSRTSGGVGLGLAIARRAVVLHRGRISARNAGPGLAVSIELPL
jgi:two-component system sensor histidine kinase CpxA